MPRLTVPTPVVRSYTNGVCKKFLATKPERALLQQKVRNSLIYCAGGADGRRSARHLIRGVDEAGGVLPGILRTRPGLFWMKEKEVVQVREKVATFLRNQGLPQLAEDLMGYGKEPNRGGLITDDPAIQRFFQGLQEPLKKFGFRKKLATLLKDY